MSFIALLETLLIGPLKLVFEIIFEVANRMIGHPGWAIVVLSLVMNILVLPLYRRADAIQEEARDMDAKLHDGVAHIKKTFSGDERMMMLQTYYRQNNYKPTDAMKGSVSLLLEVPFFMAAYQFLSNLDILNGVSFGPIANLGAPDGLLVIGGLAINLLPVIMTLVNVISSMLYLKGYPLKTKIQLYGMALFFLVFLYTSPACLVFYWTLNNLFSLVKTIFYKIKNPQKVIGIICSLCGVAILLYGGFVYDTESVARRLFFVIIGCSLQIPVLVPIIKSKLNIKEKDLDEKPSKLFFILGATVLTVLVGLLIPSTFIAASPQEFMDLTYLPNPLLYIVSCFCLSAGTFLVWMGMFYGLANKKGRVIFEKVVWILCGVMLVNYMFFGTDLGVISSNLQYDNGLSFGVVEQIVNVLVLCAVAFVMYFIIKKWKKATVTILLTAIIALGGMSGLNMFTIKESVDKVNVSGDEAQMPSIKLSKDGKNVVVVMLDRAVGAYVPYLFNEKPELKTKFDGFTYYDNVISFGGFTNMATPALFGGYEYTPVEMNKRSQDSLALKHNEAIMVMPRIFKDNGYETTVIDPIYANYEWISDLSFFKNAGINAYSATDIFADKGQKQLTVKNNHRNFFCFSFMKTMPLSLQPFIYDGAMYNQIVSNTEVVYSTQRNDGIVKATGMRKSFMDEYQALEGLKTMTEIKDGSSNTFMYMVNDITHEPMLLQAPDYTPSAIVDNTEYEKAKKDRFNIEGKKLKMDSSNQMIHYHANMAAMLKLGEWFDYLRANGVYDNTKIILVSDHAQYMQMRDELIMDDGSNHYKNVGWYFPLLMVKDFGRDGFTTSSEFMTNADVATLATKDTISNPTNPFTGKPINNSEKTAHEQLIINSWNWDIYDNRGNTFKPDHWSSVKDNIWDKNNWKFHDKEAVLNEHKLPE